MNAFFFKICSPSMFHSERRQCVSEGKSAVVSTPHALSPAPDTTPKMRGSKIDLCFYLHTQTAVAMAMKGDRERG